MNELPKGWGRVRLEEAASDISYGFTAKATNEAIGPKLLRITDIQDGRVNWSSVPHCVSPGSVSHRYSLQPDDIVFARTGATTGKSFLIRTSPRDAVFASYLIRVRLRSEFCAPFIAHFFNSAEYWEQITENLSGSAQPSCNASKLSEILVPVAPLAEQRRIVAALDGVLDRVNGCNQRLNAIPKLLARFRQSVLAAACSGRLTGGSCLRTDSDQVTDGLPPRWRSVSVGDVITDLKYGTAQKCSYEKRGTPVLRIPNVAKGIIDQADLKFANLPASERKSLSLQQGDVLVVRSNGSVSLVGRSAVAHESELKFAYAGYLIRLRPDQSIVDPEFLNLALSSYDVRLQIELEARSTSGVNNINGEELRALHFDLPPLTEQREIVEKVRALFHLGDQLDNHYASATTQVQSLPRSILAKAFGGDLVPTEAELARNEGRDFESAEELMTRIRSNRDAEQSGTKKVVKARDCAGQ